MGRFEDTISQSLIDAMWNSLASLIDEKLADANASDALGLREELMKHLRDGASEPFSIDTSKLSRSISLSFDERDIHKLDERFDRLMTMLPEVLGRTAEAVSRQKYPQLIAAWPKFQRQELRDRKRFERELKSRWGDMLSLLDLMLSIAREHGEAVAAADDESPTVLSRVCAHLYARIMLVASECSTLLNQGYADGAFARWRTVHEATVVLVLMADNGHALAERYVDHEAVDLWQEYVSETIAAGNDIDQALQNDPDAVILQRAYDDALKKHGTSFKATYGWAKGIVLRTDGSNNVPGFADLAAAAGRAAEADDYKFASYHIHPTARSFGARLGMLGLEGLLTGPSNAGLEVAAAYVADSIVLAMAYYAHDALALECLIAVHLGEHVRDELARQAVTARDRLLDDHRANNSSTPNSDTF